MWQKCHRNKSLCRVSRGAITQSQKEHWPQEPLREVTKTVAPNLNLETHRGGSEGPRTRSEGKRAHQNPSQVEVFGEAG